MFRIRCVVEGRDQICFGCSGLTLQEHIQELGEGEEAWDCIITGEAGAQNYKGEL